jgi:peroxiredoxin/mono/diheme cytochrome c family protein
MSFASSNVARRVSWLLSAVQEFRMTRLSLSWILFASVTLVVGPSVRAGEPAIDRGIGQQVADFTLLDTGGKEVHLYGFAGKTGVVAVFIGKDCPLSDLYLPRLNELARKYERSGFVFLAIDSNHGEKAAALAEHVKKLGVTFPVLIDGDNLVADTFQAERTCEALVIDGSAMLRYRGAIDDQYTQKARKAHAEKNYVVDAVDAVIARKPVQVPATTVSGCLIERVKSTAKPITGPRVRASTPADPAEANAKPIDVGRVTFAADVAPILQNKCQQCHRPGQVAPFALLDYEQTRGHADTIREVVADRRMPPWHADPRFGHFSNDRSLSARERAILLAWIDQGTPAGDAKQAPAAKTFAEGWGIGKPDYVFKMRQPYTVAANGVLAYQYFRVPTGFKEDTWIQAAEARPGDRSVVHHILVSIDDHKGSRSDDGAEGFFVAYAPGDVPVIYPEGTAKLVPAGSDLIFQVHYTPIGTEKVDCSSVGLIVAKAPVKHKAMTVGIAQRQFAIPPGDANYGVDSTFTLPRGAELLSFFPHMHLRGKSFQYTAVYPNGTTEVLLSVPAYDFGWQSAYRLTEPKRLPRGTRIDCVAHFDNSTKNSANPDPTKTVRWGEQTFEEMMIGYFDCVLDPVADKEPRKERTASATRPIGTWKSSAGQATAEIKITEEGFELSLSLPPNKLAFEADCTTTKDGTLFGRVRKVKVGNGPVFDDVFGFQYELHEDTLKITSWKGSGVMAQGVILEGTYTRGADKAKTK